MRPAPTGVFVTARAQRRPRGARAASVLAGAITSAVAIAALAGTTAGCPRPPVGPPDDEPPPPGRVGPLALEAFTQDRPAIGGKWYDYNPDGHTLDPKAQAWIVREPAEDGGAPRHAAFRIVSIYEADRAESGRFTLALALHDGVSWGAESTWTAPRNIKDTGPLCVDLFTADGTGADLDCAGDGWQVRFALQSRFSPLSGIAVADPSVFVRSVAGSDAFGRVTVARLDDVTSLGPLPDPTAIAALDDAPATGWDSTDWAFERFAPDQPEAGMAIGSRVVGEGFVATGDAHWLMTSRFELVRFAVAPVVEGDPTAGLRFTYAVVEADRDDWSAPETLPEPKSVDVALPAPDSATWLTFTTPTLLPAAEHLEGTSWPFLPPKTTRFDLEVQRVVVDGTDSVRLLVSPAACALNATQRGFDEEIPPVTP